MHRVFIRGKRREYVIAHSALICVQVHAWSFWLDADEHHPGFALRTGGSLKCNRRWNGGRWALRLGHNASPKAPPAQAGARARSHWITVGSEVCDPLPNCGGWRWFLRKRQPRIRSAAWGVSPTSRGRGYSPGVGKGRGARNRTLGRDVGSYRYPITLTCFLLQLKSVRTSAPRLPGPSQPRTWVFPPAHYCESSLSYASTPACGLRCQLDVTEALLFLAANSARKGRR